METWRVELTAEGKGLTGVKIQSGVFQRDALSSLLLVIQIYYSGFLRLFSRLSKL